MSVSTVEKPLNREYLGGDVESGSDQERFPVYTDDLAPPKVATSFWEKLSGSGVELRGVEPVPVEKRTDTRYVNVLTVFSTSMTSLLPIGIGSATTLGYGLSLRDAALMIVFLQILFSTPAAYIITIAPRTGMRQMVQSRYCFGKYGNILTSIMVTLTVGGFSVTGSIQGGQALSAVQSGSKLSIPGGIAIIMVMAMLIGFMGYRVLHLFARWAWIPSLFAILVLVGCASSNLHRQSPSTAHGAAAYLNMVAFAAGNTVTWGNVVGDVACYMPPKTPKFRLACYCLFGIAVPFSLMNILGAAIGGAIFSIPSWTEAYNLHGMGGVISTILVTRLGNFGRFILVLLGLSVIATCARDIYSISFNIQTIAPILRKVPRAIFSIVATGVIIGVAIPASRSFVTSVIAFLSIIGYYAGASVTCFLAEWFVFRHANPDNLNPSIWNDARALPTGISAIAAVAIPWALIVPSMEQEWYTGPIAKHTGDLGFEFAVVVALLAYVPIRALEVKLRGRV